MLVVQMAATKVISHNYSEIFGNYATNTVSWEVLIL